MKKKAFTLAEVLIALGILGIIAAVAVPAISQIIPDKNKAMYLRSYNALMNKTKEIAYDTSIYGPYYEDSNGNRYDVSYYPLINTSAPMDPYAKDLLKNTNKLKKYAILMRDALNGEALTDNNSAVTKFRTKDGIEWKIYDSQIVDPFSTGGDGSFYNEVLVDVNGFDEEPNKVYGENGYKKRPDQFKFKIYASGDVVPVDRYGQMYICYRINLLRNKNEEQLLEDGIKNGEFDKRFGGYDDKIKWSDIFMDPNSGDDDSEEQLEESGESGESEVEEPNKPETDECDKYKSKNQFEYFSCLCNKKGGHVTEGKIKNTAACYDKYGKGIDVDASDYDDSSQKCTPPKVWSQSKGKCVSQDNNSNKCTSPKVWNENVGRCVNEWEGFTSCEPPLTLLNGVCVMMKQ